MCVDAVDIVENDRPYAGYLYLGMGYHTRDNKQLDTIEFNLGIVGPWSQADETQDFVHDIRGIEKFQGWHNQLENRREIIWQSREQICNLPNAVKMHTGTEFVSRTYRIIADQQPIMLINEKFPIASRNQPGNVQ